MKLSCIITLFIFSCCISIQAYPTKPISLFDLVEHAKLIVIGKVINDEGKGLDNSLLDQRATFVVDQLLKGTLQSDTIHIYYSSSFGCPIPPKYHTSNYYELTFLAKLKNDDGYAAASWDDGVIRSPYKKENLDILSQRIKEALDILNIEDQVAQKDRLTGWVMKCLEHQITRRDGTLEIYVKKELTESLAYSMEGVRSYDLTAQQINHIRSILFNIDQFKVYDLDLVNIVKNGDDPELLQYLIDSMKKLSDRDLFMADLFMGKIARVWERDDLYNFYLELDNDFPFGKKDYKRKRKTIKAFIKMI